MNCNATGPLDSSRIWAERLEPGPGPSPGAPAPRRLGAQAQATEPKPQTLGARPQAQAQAKALAQPHTADIANTAHAAHTAHTAHTVALHRLVPLTGSSAQGTHKVCTSALLRLCRLAHGQTLAVFICTSVLGINKQD